jgi:hypothetical protein
MLRWAVFGIAILVAGAALASMEGPCTVWQPILTQDGGPISCPVTYTCFGDLWASPGWMVSLAFAENRIGTREGFQDRNAAHLFGFEFSLVRHPLPLQPNQTHGLFGDTLRVVVDVSRYEEAAADIQPLLLGFPVDGVLAVTLECMRANASLEYPRFRFLDVRVTGSEPLAAHSGVFEVSPREDRLR